MELAAQTAVSLHTNAPRDGVLTLAIAGRLDSDTTGTIWPAATEAVAAALVPQILIDASRLEYCDSAGIALLAQLRHQQQQKGGDFEIFGLRSEIGDLLREWPPEDLAFRD